MVLSPAACSEAIESTDSGIKILIHLSCRLNQQSSWQLNSIPSPVNRNKTLQTDIWKDQVISCIDSLSRRLLVHAAFFYFSRIGNI